jgi:hypothetical protein
VVGDAGEIVGSSTSARPRTTQAVPQFGITADAVVVRRRSSIAPPAAEDVRQLTTGNWRNHERLD